MLFTWTDEETALLLRVVMEYKIYKMEGGSDWETVKQKYEDIKGVLALKPVFNN